MIYFEYFIEIDSNSVNLESKCYPCMLSIIEKLLHSIGERTGGSVLNPLLNNFMNITVEDG